MWNKIKKLSWTSPWINGTFQLSIMVLIAISVLINGTLWWEIPFIILYFIYGIYNINKQYLIEDGYMSAIDIYNETYDYYKKERIIVHSNDQIILSISQANDFIRYVWGKEGKKIPPLIIAVDGDSCIAGRFVIKIVPDMCTRTIILHEVAHLISPRLGHREKFIRTYVNLLERYIKLDINGEMLYHLLRLDSPLLQVIDGRVYMRQDENNFVEYNNNGEPSQIIPVCPYNEK
jgi:hypothetical protein